MAKRNGSPSNEAPDCLLYIAHDIEIALELHTGGPMRQSFRQIDGKSCRVRVR